MASEEKKKVKSRLSHGRAKDLLKEISDEIRRRLVENDAEVEFVLNLAAVVEHMDPDTVR